MLSKGKLMQFTSQAMPDGIVETAFDIDGVPGVLWSPDGRADPTPLVLMGHPGGLHKRAAGLVSRARHLVTAYGLHAAAIDAPGHGERERSAEDAEWVDRMQAARRAGEPLGAIVAAFNGSIAERAVPEWQATMDSLLTLPSIDADRRVGYSGMTLATEIGFRLAAADPRIGAVGLGAAYASVALVEIARTVNVPVLFLLPWDDPEIGRDEGLSLFDAIGTDDKILHAFPGPHQSVPASEAEDSGRFLARHLMG